MLPLYWLNNRDDRGNSNGKHGGDWEIKNGYGFWPHPFIHFFSNTHCKYRVIKKLTAAPIMASAMVS